MFPPRRMQPPCERLPVELWHQIIRDALKNPCLNEVEDHDQDQHSYEKMLRVQDVTTRRQVQQELGVTRRNVRSVCRSWRGFTDTIFDEWVEVNDLLSKRSLYSPRAVAASYIDYSATEAFGRIGTKEPSDHPKSGRPRNQIQHRARILTLNSSLSSIDTFLHLHGHIFPTLQVLDLRPATTFLTPKGGVSAGPDFFSTLSSLFPALSSLLVDVPGSSTPDVLDFPHLRRLSYNIIGQSRLSDWQRGAQIAKWSLPAIEHVSLNPVGCSADWEMVLSSLRAWGTKLKSLCLAAEFPDSRGIIVGAKDWSICPQLKVLRFEGTNVCREVTEGPSSIGKVTDTPQWHPFYQVAAVEP